MKFKNTILFSPVSEKVDLPYDNDLFYYDSVEIPDNETKYFDYIKKNAIEIDEHWWTEQDRRVKYGYTVSDCVEKGGDAIIDGRDAIWNDTAKPMEYYNENFDLPIIIPPESVYLVDAHETFINGNVKITNRHYWYLNFWKIIRLDRKTNKKDYLAPRFTDMDYLKFSRMKLQELFGLDNTELKARQKGFSEASAGGLLGYNYCNVPASENIIMSGNEEDSYNLFMKTMNGLDQLKNTQFYKSFSKKSTTKEDMKLISKYYKSSIQAFFTNKNTQKLSRLSPYCVIYEEVGKWEKGLLGELDTFVTPSLFAENVKTGFRTYIGTGGDMGRGAEDLMQVHYSNNGQFLRFKNKFEREYTNGKSGWFTSNAWFKELDKEGNSYFKVSHQQTIDEIETIKDPIKKYIKTTQSALYAEDAFLISTAGFFGEAKINLLNARLSEIRLNPNLQIQRYGILEWKNQSKPFEGVIFIETEKDDAWLTLIEEPILDENKNPYLNLYEGGVDSYDQDESLTSSSKGAVIIRKKMLNTSTTYKIDVAMIFERPKIEKGGAFKFYEHTTMLSIYYNFAKLTIEHTKVRIIDYLVNNGFESLIALRPTLAFANIVNRSNAQNKYGIDGSMKPHVMAEMSETLTPEFIGQMFITEQIDALAKYKYSRTYNCDITVASAHANIGAKETLMIVPKSYESKERTVNHSYYFIKNGKLIRSSI